MAAVRQKIHLTRCPVLPGHLSSTNWRRGDQGTSVLRTYGEEHERNAATAALAFQGTAVGRACITVVWNTGRSCLWMAWLFAARIAGNYGIVLYDSTDVVPFGDRLAAAPLSCLWG